ncbi:MAG: DUF2442 domain-containing protein [Bacteroidales bacterium]|jgi:hypothetical protein|nr:DUF2442 domain-containing protein [Bacteroidales bacterium]
MPTALQTQKLWFTDDRIFIETDGKEVLSQPLRFFWRLQQATEDERNAWKESCFGLHWKNIDEDISFESFRWQDNEETFSHISS